MSDLFLAKPGRQEPIRTEEEIVETLWEQGFLSEDLICRNGDTGRWVRLRDRFGSAKPVGALRSPFSPGFLPRDRVAGYGKTGARFRSDRRARAGRAPDPSPAPARTRRSPGGNEASPARESWHRLIPVLQLLAVSLSILASACAWAVLGF